MITARRASLGLGTLAVVATAAFAACGGGSMSNTGGASSSTSSGGSGGLPSTSGSTGSTTSTTGTGGSGGSVPQGEPFVYVGGYGDQIHVFHLDLADGSLAPAGSFSAGTNPSFLAVDPAHRTLLAVNEDGGGKGSVASFRIDAKTGGLTFVNRVSSQGDGPAHVSTDGTGAFALVANYGGGTVAVLPLAANGMLSEAVDVHDHGGGSANPHQILTDASNAHAYVPNKGKDTVTQYGFDAATGKLANPTTLTVASGAGPRHLDLHPTSPHAYLLNELGSTIVALARDPSSGALSSRQTLSTLPAGFTGANTCAEVQVAPSGRFVYASNRGHDSIAIFAVQPDGKLSLVGHQPTMGKTPRHFHLEPSGRVLVVANVDSSNVVTFKVDPDAGTLTPTGQSVSVPSPSYAGVVYLASP
ncbi:6-phosphogluconolactonase [Minicystis rosea]|nr:6-phosphogluconolactonase [Minicystis rosea]